MAKTFLKGFLFIYLVTNCLPAMGSIGDLSKWDHTDIEIGNISDEEKEVFLQNYTGAPKDQKFRRYVFQAPVGKLYLLSPIYKEASHYCNTDKECLTIVFYKRNFDGKNYIFKFWSPDLINGKPRLNHQEGKNSGVSIDISINKIKVLLTIYAEGEIELQSY